MCNHDAIRHTSAFKHALQRARTYAKAFNEEWAVILTPGDNNITRLMASSLKRVRPGDVILQRV